MVKTLIHKDQFCESAIALLLAPPPIRQSSPPGTQAGLR